MSAAIEGLLFGWKKNAEYAPKLVSDLSEEQMVSQPAPEGKLPKITVERTAEGLLGVRERHGADALGFVSSSRCTCEENFLMQKVARAAFGTNNVHQCAAT